ncbi:hypothetical protein BN946_scf184615.g14 [Trametes cinnabarina]|uniref:DNA-binding protein n=1 Tax=Pycnoporus cinnabarinus TaxID=5643 RepID=A0A060SVI2_PYCCI|nr:hypothetical protein BN946_scf184615.g14 [Trametes cinnabarina]
MVKSRRDVIMQFNEEVNMTANELERWLDGPKSTKAGTGAGIESGHKIVEILRKNPTRDPEKYDDEDIEHMRKVVSYTKRHLAQEDHLKETKTRTELENTKSTISLKNWGHDPIKTLDVESEEEPSEDEQPQEPPKQNDNEKLSESDSGGNVPASTDEKATNKRKLDDEDSPETQDGDDEVDAEADEVDVGEAASVDKAEADSVDAGEDKDCEDRPRKKSKRDGDE